MREMARSVGSWTGSWPVTTLLLALCLTAEGAFAQSWERAYDASVGTLPSAQGWDLVTVDPAPADGLGATNFSVVGDALVQGDTGGASADPGNSQWHEVSLPAIDFENEHLLVEARLRVVNSTGTAPDDVPSNVRPDAGFDIWLSDEHEDSFQMGIASDFVMFRKWIVGNEPFADFDTTDGFHTYEIRIGGDAAVVSIDGVEVMEQTTGLPQSFASPNLLRFGDLTSFESSSTELEWIRVSRTAIPDASVRNYSRVTETFSSGSQSSFEASVSCPAGSYALGGGVEPIGANGSLGIVWSRPGAGSPATSWEGKAREIVPTGTNWEMRVDVICGELSGFTRYDETRLPMDTSPGEYKYAAASCGEGETLVGGGSNIVGPEQNIVLEGSRVIETGTAREFRTSATDLGAGAASSQAWTVETHAFCSDAAGFELVEESTLILPAPNKSFSLNCPSGKVPISGGGSISGHDAPVITVSRPKDGAPGEPPVGWIVEAQNSAPLWALYANVVCAPIADPTVSKAGMVTRIQGADAGSDSWGTGHGDALGGTTFATNSAIGTAFEFDGSDGQRVELPGQLHNLYFPDSFTIDAWIQSDGVTRGEGNRIAMLYDWGGLNNWGGTNPSTFILALNPDGYAYASQRSYFEGAPIEQVFDDIPLDDGEPHHVAMVRDKKANLLRLYVDGVEVDSHFMEPGFSVFPMWPGHPAFPDPVTIGGGYQVGDSETTFGFEGLINDVKFYERPLTPGEIEEIAGCGVPVLPRVINLDARRFGSPSSESYGLCAQLEAGDYVVTVVSPEEEPLAVHTGWSPDAAGAWGTEFHIDPEIDPGVTFGQSPIYGSAEDAFDGLATKAFVMSLTSDQRVDFSVEDLLNFDNRGGVSIRVEEYVPEPGFAIGLMAGCALLAHRGIRRPTPLSRGM